MFTPHIGSKFSTRTNRWGGYPIDLHHVFEDIRQREVERHSKRFTPDNQEELEVFSRNLLRKFLVEPTKLLKSYSLKNPEEMERLAAIREVFRLDQTEGGEDDNAP